MDVRSREGGNCTKPYILDGGEVLWEGTVNHHLVHALRGLCTGRRRLLGSEVSIWENNRDDFVPP
jgi:hypothetical protein